VTADGEQEHPQGLTPTPSRDQGSVKIPTRGESGSSDGQSPSSPSKHDDNKLDGHWATAVDKSSSRPKANNRFSSFRDSTTPPAHRNTLHSLHSNKDKDNEQPESPMSGANPAQDHEEESEEHVRDHAQQGWAMLRNRVLPGQGKGRSETAPGHNTVSALSSTAIASVPITTELLAGQLPVMMLKTWLDRDEDGRKAVPVLLGNMRFRVGDSVGLKQEDATGREMFKVECEYGDGAVKWVGHPLVALRSRVTRANKQVIYRELRDFLSLHAHYKAANFGTSVGGLRGSRKVDIPEFPKMSIPYLKSLRGNQTNKEKNMNKADYAQASRDALQKYLVELIRAVVRPLLRPISRSISYPRDYTIVLINRFSDLNQIDFVNSLKSPPSLYP